MRSTQTLANKVTQKLHDDVYLGKRSEVYFDNSSLTSSLLGNLTIEESANDSKDETNKASTALKDLLKQMDSSPSKNS